MSLSLRCEHITVLLGIVGIVMLTGCAEVRKLTYSEDFTYVENREVKSLMRKMQKGVHKLGEIVSTASGDDKMRQQNIISELSSLESISARLSAGHTQTNQLFISDHIERFIADIGTAKLFAKATPPDYSRIEDIVNNCQECHQSR